MAVVNDEVIEVRLQSGRRPHLAGGPSACPSRDREAAHAHSSAHIALGDQNAAVRGHGRLQAGEALPRVLPKHPAIGWRHTSGAAAVQDYDLLFSADSQYLRGTVADAALRLNPAWSTGRWVVGGKPSGSRDNYKAINRQR